MLCYVMLCYVMLCYVMLCYVMLCYVMLCYVMLCYVILFHLSNIKWWNDKIWCKMTYQNTILYDITLFTISYHIITYVRYVILRIFIFISIIYPLHYVLIWQFFHTVFIKQNTLFHNIRINLLLTEYEKTPSYLPTNNSHVFAISAEHPIDPPISSSITGSLKDGSRIYNYSVT